jgi:hypothetical protein
MNCGTRVWLVQPRGCATPKFSIGKQVVRVGVLRQLHKSIVRVDAACPPDLGEALRAEFQGPAVALSQMIGTGHPATIRDAVG